jgi:hypothetical protein
VQAVGGCSTGVTGAAARVTRRPHYWFASRRRSFVKKHGRLYALCADVVWLSGYVLWRIRRVLQGKPDTDPPHVLWDCCDSGCRRDGTHHRGRGAMHVADQCGGGVVPRLAAQCGRGSTVSLLERMAREQPRAMTRDGHRAPSPAQSATRVAEAQDLLNTAARTVTCSSLHMIAAVPWQAGSVQAGSRWLHPRRR